MRYLLMALTCLLTINGYCQSVSKIYYKDVADGCVKNYYYSFHKAVQDGDKESTYVIDKDKKIVNFAMGGYGTSKESSKEEANKKIIAHLECVIQPILN